MSDTHAADARRRFFLRAAAATALAAPALSLVPARSSAASLPKLDPEADERARQFQYTHDASTVAGDQRSGDARCANCTHFRGDATTRWAPCNIFPEHRVHADGWCTSYFSAG